MKAKTAIIVLAVLGFLTLRTPAWDGDVVRPSRWTEPVPLTEVNSDSVEEWSPFLSYDGLTLYFARVRSENFYYGRIFEATRDEPFGPFTSIREINGTLNSSPGHVLLPWVSPDNLRMYYHNELGGRFKLMISERTSVNAPWPEGTGISELNVLGNQIQSPRLTSDELTIFFNAYDIPGGHGAYDIWVASRHDRNFPFGQVRNLDEINTASSEGVPFCSPDGLTLLFHSNRNGEEQFQLFQATRESLTEPFGNIEHLSVFDTPGGSNVHPCLAADGSTLYFMRQLGQDRSSRDIYVSYISKADTYYVDAVNGNDLNNGLSLQTAFANIQKGIDSAEDGFTVLVYPGLYTEEINFKSKAITVQGLAGTVGGPVLENPDDFAVSFYNGEGPDSVLKNFIIKNNFMAVFIAGSSPTISNVTLVDNKYGIKAYAGAQPDISNCIFWNNTDGDLLGCQARYSCTKEIDAGEDNIDADPLFVDPNNGDYHLLSERGRYWPQHDVWVLDKVTSPCIDGGDPAADPSGEPMPNGGRINMGAYGQTPYASMSEMPWLDPDVNRDGVVDTLDMAKLIEIWLEAAGWCE